MNRFFDALASFNRFLDVAGSVVVGIAVLLITIAVFKPVFTGIGNSAVGVAKLAARHVTVAISRLIAENSVAGDESKRIVLAARSRNG